MQEDSVPPESGVSRTPQAGANWNDPRPQDIPRPTYSPAVVALGIACLLWGLVTTYWISLLGAILLAVGLGGWIVELRHEHGSPLL